MIEVKNLGKRYGDKVAVDDLSFTVRPGIVTGFLGPNGAGKSTTMRMIVGLDAPTSGTVTVNGRRYADHRARRCTRSVRCWRPRRCTPAGRRTTTCSPWPPPPASPERRVDEVIDLVGLREVARKRAGGFSLGMGQRLGIASALLGDPHTVLLDEPVNGLDPEGVRWIRNLLKELAAEGRTVFISSHLMSEMALTAEHLVVVGKGRLIADVPMAKFCELSSAGFVRVRSPAGAPAQRVARRPGRHDQQ